MGKAGKQTEQKYFLARANENTERTKKQTSTKRNIHEYLTNKEFLQI
jgi:hypothetical protein